MVTENSRPMLFIECKQKDKSVSGALRYLKVRFPGVTAIQLYQGEGADRIDRDGIRICPAHRFFAELV